MAEESISSEDIAILSGEVHSYESFGRSVVSAALASAAEQGQTIAVGATVPITASVTVKVLKRGLVWTCVEVPPFGRICTLQRPDRD